MRRERSGNEAIWIDGAVSGQLRQDARLILREAGLARRSLRDGGSQAVSNLLAELIDDVTAACDELRPILNERVAPFTRRSADGPRHRKDVPTLLEGVSRRYEGAAPGGGLHDQRPEREPREDAVPPREVPGEWWCFERELGQDRAGLYNALRQAQMLSRVHVMEPGAQDGNRAAGGFERRPVNGRVDAARESAHERRAALSEVGAQALGHLESVRRGRPRAYDGERHIIFGGERAPGKKRQRGIGDTVEKLGKARPAPRQDRKAALLALRDLVLRRREGAPSLARKKRREHLFGRSEFFDELDLLPVGKARRESQGDHEARVLHSQIETKKGEFSSPGQRRSRRSKRACTPQAAGITLGSRLARGWVHSRYEMSTSRLRTWLLVASLEASFSAAVARADIKPQDKAQQQVEFGIEVARRGLWKEAIYRWQKAVEIDPSNAKARNNLAVAYEQEGEFELAEAEYKRALELDSENLYIRQNYELFREAYEKRKRKNRASSP